LQASIDVHIYAPWRDHHCEQFLSGVSPFGIPPLPGRALRLSQVVLLRAAFGIPVLQLTGFDTDHVICAPCMKAWSTNGTIERLRIADTLIELGEGIVSERVREVIDNTLELQISAPVTAESLMMSYC
jgi:hypothetical protein